MRNIPPAAFTYVTRVLPHVVNLIGSPYGTRDHLFIRCGLEGQPCVRILRVILLPRRRTSGSSRNGQHSSMFATCSAGNRSPN